MSLDEDMPPELGSAERPPNDVFLAEESEQPPREPGRLEKPPPRSYLTFVLGAYFICLLMSLLSWDATYEIHFWVSRELLEQHHAYWRLFTALAAHADWQHLLANAPLFIIFGWLLRSYFGWWFFPVLPVLAGAGANYLTLQWYEPWQRLLGCSGMVYAMVGMWLVLYIRYETRFSLPMRFFRCMGFSFIILMPTTLHPTTSYLAHAFGFLLGLVCALVFA